MKNILTKETVSDFIVQRLYDWGIRRIYGYPGDGINGVITSLANFTEKIDFVQARHEELAAFMACAHAKFTGEIGVCLATSGPGAIHLLNGLYDAKMDHQPVLAIVGQQAKTALGSEYQQEVDLLSLFKDVAHEYVQTAVDPWQVRHLIDQAIRIAKANRTVTCIILPADLQREDMVQNFSGKHGSVFSGIGYSYPRVIPHERDIMKAAKVLNEGKKVAMLVGAGGLGATDEIIEISEILGAGVAKALLGKAVLPDDLPFVTGSIGLIGTKPSWDLMMECDTLLMIGTGFPYAEFLPKDGKAHGVQIDIEGRMLGIRYPNEVNLQGDSKETIRALIPFLKYKKDRTWRKTIEKNVQDWWGVLEKRAMVPANPVNPQRVYWELSAKIPDNSIITADSGTSAIWYARDLKFRKGMMGSLSGNLATMGPGVPYAIAAKFAFPDRVAIALVGDGAMQMNGNNSLITVAKYWKEWSNPLLIVLVLNNRDLNMVTWEQRTMEGEPKFEDSQNVPDFPYAKYAESIGLIGLKIEKPENIGPVWEKALASDRPVLIEALTDPNVPPLPPHISFDQAKAYTAALFKGDPEAWEIIKQSMMEIVQDYLPDKDEKK
jgi:pyruvate dehydrogenase (quinone)